MNKTQQTYLGIASAVMAMPFAAMAETGTAAPAISAITNRDNPFRLEPTLHFRAAHGATTLPDHEVEFGGHDPSQDSFNFQGFEISTNIFLGENVSGFAGVNIFKNDGEDFESEFEEGFLKLHNLPGGFANFEIRAGRMLARLGDQNARHLHAWDFVDNNILNVRYLGEDGFAFDGGEITWLLPTGIKDALSIGLGSAVAHEHEEEGDDDDHSEEAEMARPDKNIISVRYQAEFGSNDFHRFQAGGSFLTGDNGFGMTTDIYGADFTYTWRENGLESGGRQFRWRTEWLMRDVENDEGGFDDSGLSTALLWQFIENWEAGLRYGYVEGVSDPELAERNRTSLALTRFVDFGNEITGILRLQYNHDDIKGHGNENSIWFQFGFDWGPGEVR